jgi:hypothetical protein
MSDEVGLRCGSVRRQRACEAALEVARRLGIHAKQAGVLKDWNNTIIRLAPAGIVAKVGTSHFRDARLESLDREVAVAAHLAERGAPVVPPTRVVPPGPHCWRELKVTLWQYLEPLPGAAPTATTMAAAIKRVHEALGDFEGALPEFTLELDDASRLLKPDRSPALAPADRRFLLGQLSLRCRIKYAWQAGGPLNGGPTRKGWL